MTQTPADPARTLAVVVHYGDPELTERCVRSIAQGTAKPVLLAVVDNAPEAIGLERFEAVDVPWRLIRPGANIGFAGAVNLALRECPRFDHAWLLNNDATARPTALEELLATAGRMAEPALVSSVVLDEADGSVWFERARFYPWRLESKHTTIRGTTSSDIVDRARPSWTGVPYLPACSLLVPAAAVDPSGIFDDAYFVYGEDVALALKAADRGWPLVLARRSIVAHRPSSATTSLAREALTAEAGARLVRSRYPVLLPLATWNGLVLGLVRGVLERQSHRVTARLAGYRRGWSGRRPPAP